MATGGPEPTDARLRPESRLCSDGDQRSSTGCCEAARSASSAAFSSAALFIDGTQEHGVSSVDTALAVVQHRSLACSAPNRQGAQTRSRPHVCIGARPIRWSSSSSQSCSRKAQSPSPAASNRGAERPCSTLKADCHGTESQASPMRARSSDFTRSKVANAEELNAARLQCLQQGTSAERACTLTRLSTDVQCQLRIYLAWILDRSKALPPPLYTFQEC